MRNGSPGSSGLFGVVAAVIGVSLLMTIVDGQVLHWLPIGVALLVSLGIIRIFKR